MVFFLGGGLGFSVLGFWGWGEGVNPGLRARAKPEAWDVLPLCEQLLCRDFRGWAVSMGGRGGGGGDGVHAQNTGMYSGFASLYNMLHTRMWNKKIYAFRDHAQKHWYLQRFMPKTLIFTAVFVSLYNCHKRLKKKLQ